MENADTATNTMASSTISTPAEQQEAAGAEESGAIPGVGGSSATKEVTEHDSLSPDNDVPVTEASTDVDPLPLELEASKRQPADHDLPATGTPTDVAKHFKPLRDPTD